MKINEIYNIEKEWNEIDRVFNPENYKARDEEDTRYKEIATLSMGETPVITKEPRVKHKWTNTPQKDAAQSPGYRAGESVKKGAGVPYKKYDKYEYSTHPTPNSY